ncbi:MAG: sugar fermentation stimulation protein [Epulopiscium sp.]|jgi:sugar fermentation stimulation protein A|uniref:Sugar fermentation stimulation protein homolog n=1 Tax=Defluviitalea raffinosedens TaxID=1450156 RepID=A0A7C8HE46_9FIRM|nr:DNA/RNA nuclease SfsA [Defluviitalea raffinosedens]MBZ4668736.1 sfsA [Defluviitaleaceae bacterium]MDK2788207.1 sugar fermentation stimulation protein [Candidatus Epulonipiscium sp.]KAE9633499.1 DNA/RNA nuclease SfsA [Defluviitalea raffinosedens]MBM7685971.1 sugar fermentation stimulation protein A [Defluviitalea raffinosedens]HHW68186.1 DNA/RNA nuclease SfsA [Candidatus Epulonipiscium sp.]
MKLNYEICYGTFIKRPNRFIAHVNVSGKEVICHVPNTGRLKELLYPGVKVMLSYHPSSTRKTNYELRMVQKENSWISIDSQLPNALAHEAVLSGIIEELKGYPVIKKEVSYSNSRFDLQLMGEDGICFVEVKGVTLEKDQWSFFPDAPTERGRKHIDEMIHAVNNGYRGAILFVVQIEYAKGFSPNVAMDPAFAQKIKEAQGAGVKILAYRCSIAPDEVKIVESIPVKI